MRLRNILIVVKDIERSKKFYHDLFGLDIVLGNDGNIILTEGLVLQDEKIWKVPVIQKSRIKYRTILRHLIQLCKCVYKPSDEQGQYSRKRGSCQIKKCPGRVPAPDLRYA